jgi:hypothetical protein
VRSCWEIPKVDAALGHVLPGQGGAIVIAITDFDRDGDVVRESCIQDVDRGLLVVEEVLRNIGIVLD